MYSLDEFYFILYKNLLEPCQLIDASFYPYGSTNIKDLSFRFAKSQDKVRYPHFKLFHYILFYDQEPLFKTHSAQVFDRFFFNNFKSNKKFNILATSEHSQEKRDIVRENLLYDWYYFFHGFASLEWYKVHKHLPVVDRPFTKLFISLNRLVTKDRSYRLNLVSRMMEHNLLDQGLVSLQLSDEHGTWRDEIFSSDSLLSVESKKLILKNISKLDAPLVVDHYEPVGTLSANPDIELQQSALWNVVSETVFYHDKLHLTEKIFKPIVARRPFILVGAQGNLAYLKSYGFKTFDQWIDESYDLEADPDLRIQMVVNELDKLSKLDYNSLLAMHQEMQEVLDYNFNHFYGDFKTIIVNELVDNFQGCLNQYNCGRIGDSVLKPNINFADVKRRMLL
jgi:hypothetical protein